MSLTELDTLMTDGEHAALELTADLADVLVGIIVGPNEAQDIAEVMGHLHAIQRAVLSNAAARVFPDKYRLLGGDVERLPMTVEGFSSATPRPSTLVEVYETEGTLEGGD